MKEYFEQLSRKIKGCESDVEARVQFICAARHLLQMVGYGLLEWVGYRSPAPETQPPADILDALKSPADGTLVDALDALLVSADQNGWSGLYRVGISELPGVHPAQRLCGEASGSLFSLLRKIVAMRNDGGEGHGLPGAYDREAEHAAYEYILETLAPFLPRLCGSEIYIGPDGAEVRARLLLCVRNSPVLVRKIKVVNSSKVRVQAQYYGEDGTLASHTYEAFNTFSAFSGLQLPQFTRYANDWQPLCYLPDRITDTFTGRAEEVVSMREWISDSESRACLVYGDGGVGKTTFVVEVLHQMLEEEWPVEWRPQVISFYTAKRSQFGVDGLGKL